MNLPEYFLPGGLQCQGQNGYPTIATGIRCQEAALHVCEHIIGYKDPARPGYGAIHCGKVFCDDCGDHGESDCCEECRSNWTRIARFASGQLFGTASHI